MAEQKRLANDPDTDPAVKAKILDSMMDRAGLSATQTHRLISAEQADPVEKLFRAIAADPNGLEPPREQAETAISGPATPPALEPPTDLAQDAYDRLVESHVPDADVVELQPTDFGTMGPHAISPPKPQRVVDSGRTPKHIRDAIANMERERRGFR